MFPRTLLVKHAVDAAVLDLHFCQDDLGLFSVAQSNGVLSFWRVALVEDTIAIAHLKNLQVCDSSILVLSHAWCPFTSKQARIAASMSDGTIKILDFAENWTIESQSYAHSHRLEAWTLAWSATAPNEEQDPQAAKEPVIYSGGDDATICKWQISALTGRNGDEQLEAERFLQEEVPMQRLKGTARYGPSCVQFDTSTHDAGVTAIIPLSDLDEDTIVTGSYDEHIRILRPTPHGRWRVLAEQRLGGGVWRLKLIERQRSQSGVKLLILASCMHAGSRIVQLLEVEGQWSISIMARFENHESMNYSSDAKRMNEDGRLRRFTVISTSFYDKRLCVWEVDGLAEMS